MHDDESVKEARARRGDIPETAPSPGGEIGPSEKGGLFQMILDFYGLAMVPDHHSLRISPVDASPKILYNVNPGRRISAAIKAKLSSGQMQTSGPAKGRWSRADNPGAEVAKDLPLVVRKLAGAVSVEVSSFIYMFLNTKRQMYKMFMFYYVFCAKALFPSQRNVLFPQTAISKDSFQAETQLMILKTEEEFYSRYSALMYSAGNNNHVIGILKEALPSLVGAENSSERDESKRNINQIFDEERSGFFNIMSLGTTMDKIHTALCMYNLVEELQTMSAISIQGEQRFVVEASPATVTAFEAEVKQKTDAEARKKIFKVILEFLTMPLISTLSESNKMIVYAVGLFAGAGPVIPADFLQPILNAWMEYVFERVKLNDFTSRIRLFAVSVQIQNADKMAVALVTLLYSKLAQIPDNISFAEKVWQMFLYLPDNVVKGVFTELEKKLTAPGDWGRYGNMMVKIEEIGKITPPRTTRVVFADVSQQDAVKLVTGGIITNILTKSEGTKSKATLDPQLGKSSDMKYEDVIKPVELKAEDFHIKQFVLSELARELGISSMELAQSTKVKIESLEGSLAKAFANKTDAMTARTILRTFWRSNAVKTIAPDVLLRVYKRLVLGHYPLTTEVGKESSITRLRNDLDLKLGQIFEAYSQVQSLHLVKARTKDEIDETLMILKNELERFAASHKDDREYWTEEEKRFWKTHGESAKKWFKTTKADDAGAWKEVEFDYEIQNARSRLTRKWLFDIGSLVLRDISAMRGGTCSTEHKKIFDLGSGRIEHANTHLFGVRAWKHWAIFLANHLDAILPIARKLLFKDREASHPDNGVKEIRELEEIDGEGKRVVMGKKEWKVVKKDWFESNELDGTNDDRRNIEDRLARVMAFIMDIVQKVMIKPPKKESSAKLAERKIKFWVNDLKKAGDWVAGISDGPSRTKVTDAINVLKGVLADIVPNPDNSIDKQSPDFVVRKYDNDGNLTPSDPAYTVYAPKGYVRLLKLRELFVNVMWELKQLNADKAIIRNLLFDYNQTAGVVSYIFAFSNQDLEFFVSDTRKWPLHLVGIKNEFHSNLQRKASMKDAAVVKIKEMDTKLIVLQNYITSRGYTDPKPGDAIDAPSVKDDQADEYGNAFASLMDTST